MVGLGVIVHPACPIFVLKGSHDEPRVFPLSFFYVIYFISLCTIISVNLRIFYLYTPFSNFFFWLGHGTCGEEAGDSDTLLSNCHLWGFEIPKLFPKSHNGDWLVSVSSLALLPCE